MATAELALLISGISVCIAMLALGWNIYRDVILRPKVRIRMQISQVLTPGEPAEKDETKVDFTATNHGPGIVILQGIRAKTKKLFKKTKWAILIHDYTDPLTSQFPCKLGVGERGTFLLPFLKGSFLKQSFTHLGIADSFGRIHWVPKKDIKRTKATYIGYFGKESNSKDSSQE